MIMRNFISSSAYRFICKVTDVSQNIVLLSWGGKKGMNRELNTNARILLQF